MNFRTYARHALVLLFGSGAAQLVNLASYPVLTRLYDPGDFGGFALFIAVLGIVAPIASARFDLIVQSSRDWQLPAVFRRAMRMSVVIALAVLLIGAVYAVLSGELSVWIAVLLAGGVFLSGYTLTATALLIRQERYVLSARVLLARSLVTAIAQIGLWYAFADSYGLIVGFLAGFAAHAILLRLSLDTSGWRRPTPKRGRAILARYRSQVLTDIPSTLLGGLVIHVTSLLVLDLYSRDDVGFYSLAFRVAVLPLALISGALSQVFYQQASASYRQSGTYWPQFRFNIFVSILLSVLIFAPLGLLARPLFAFLFGAEWTPAAEMLVLLLPMLVIRFVSATVQTAPLVVGRANWLLYQHAGLIAAILVGYAAARVLGLSIADYLFLSSVLMAAVYACFIALVAARVRRGRE